MKTEKYIISGMACAACSASVQRVVSRLSGVESCDVNLITGKMTVIYNEKETGESDFISVVEKAGFGIEKETSIDDVKVKKDKKKDNDWLPLLISAVFSGLLLIISMGQMLFDFSLPQIISPDNQPYNYAITQFILMLPALIFGKRFFLKGIPLLIKGHPNMDSLVAVGAGASLIYSIAMTFQIGSNPHAVHNLYFESVAVVITLVMLGKYFEEKSKNKTADAIKKLVELAPEEAVVLRGGKEYIIPTAQVSVGDILVVKAGEKIPLDGVVTDGFSGVDEAMLTGESMPVEKSMGDNVTGGSINLNGLLKIKVTHTGSDTTLSKIIKFVEEAQSKKAPISKTADKVAGIFVPLVIMIAVISAVIWFIIGKDISFVLRVFTGVLVVACPCALGLATPTAIMVGTGMGAVNGILIRNGEVLESCHNVRAVVFDKTGTVTEGKPHVTDVLWERDEVISLAVLSESGSPHPLADAVRRYAREIGVCSDAKLLEFQNISGKGTVCKTDKGEITLGKAELLKERGIEIDEFSNEAQKLSFEGKTVMYLGLDGKAIGVIAVSDTLREESVKAFEKLKSEGIKAILLSGDNKACAEYIGKKLGADEVYSEVLPEDKAKILGEIRKKYGTVMMVGDGINDAPALSEADIGCAIGSGSDIAIESADIVLMKNSPMDAVKSVILSRLTIRNIKQNLFWAFCYNTVLIPVAAGILYPIGIMLNPMLCGLAMSLSSVFVVGNALRLRGKRL